MAFPATDLLIRVEAAPGADLTADPATWPWIDISTKARGSVSIHRGREDTYAVVDASTCTLRLADEDSRFTLDHPLGAYYPNWRRGTPIRVSLNPGTGWFTRFTGELRQCNPVWPSGNDDVAEVQVTAKGILHRLGKGKGLDSPIRRLLLRDAVTPVAYWTMEDESGATSFGSAVGGPPISFADMQPAAASTIGGSASLPKAGTTANWSGPVPTYPASSAWSVVWAMNIPSAPSVKTGLLSWNTPTSTVKKWTLFLVPQAGTDTLKLEGIDAAGNEVVAHAGMNFSAGTLTEPYGQPLYLRVTASQSGANISSTIWCTGASGTSVGSIPSFAGTIGNVSLVFHSAFPGLAGGYAMGHVAVAADVNFGSSTGGPGLSGEVIDGYQGDAARDRFRRLCDEEGIANDVDDDPGEWMGAQQRATLMEILRQTESTDGGLIFERTDGTLWFRTHADRCNRIPTLALDCAQGHVKLPFAPVGDDQRLRNSVTVSNVGGGTATYSDVDARDGIYPGSLNPNYDEESRLPYRAQWEVHLGTAEEMRIQTLPIQLHSTPDLISQWLATDIGDWITVDHLPAQYPPGQAGLVLEGYTETFDAVSLSADLNASPSRPWEVFEVEHARLGRLDTAGSQLAAAASAGATSLQVQSTDGALWITTAGQPTRFPLDVEVKGRQVTVTGITTLNPTLVGVGAAAAGNATSVTPALPAGIQAGDLLLCYAGCNDDANGATSVPSGWTQLVSLNATAKLLGKIATGADTAPTITFTGVAAGDTTLAQVAAFRNVQISVIGGNLDQLNASAQNIAYPAIGVPIDCPALLIYLGWKPNAWTSVATLAGATEIGDPSSALGTGLGLVWDYRLLTGQTSIQAGSFTVTGGVAAASRGAVLALGSTCTQTVTTNPLPADFPAGEAVRLWRPGVWAL